MEDRRKFSAAALGGCGLVEPWECEEVGLMEDRRKFCAAALGGRGLFVGLLLLGGRGLVVGLLLFGLLDASSNDFACAN